MSKQKYTLYAARSIVNTINAVVRLIEKAVESKAGTGGYEKILPYHPDDDRWEKCFQLRAIEAYYELRKAAGFIKSLGTIS